VGKYHRGTHDFSWHAKFDLRMGPRLGGERKAIEGTGRFTFDFPDKDSDVIPLVVKDFETKIPAFEISVGDRRDMKSRLSVPEFTLHREKFKKAVGWLQRSTGRFGANIVFGIAPKDVPAIEAAAKLGVLNGLDANTLTAHLFEWGHIDGTTGAIHAKSQLYLGDKTWGRPGHGSPVSTSCSQGAHCDVSASLYASVGGVDAGRSSTVVICPGTPVTLYYSMANASKGGTIIGSSKSLNETIPISQPSGTVTVTPKGPGEARYHVHAMGTDSNGNDCSADSDDVIVTVVGQDTQWHLRSQREEITSSTGDRCYDWHLSLVGIADPKIVVTGISMDNAAGTFHPVDNNSVILRPWLAVDHVGNAFFNTAPFDAFVVPVANFQLAGDWHFLPQAGCVLAGSIDPQLAGNEYSDFLLILNCR
jgi:hypothetical protein